MGMDRELTSQEIRRKKNKWIITGIIAVLAFIIGIWLLRISLSTSVDKSSITTSMVETGDVENTISASGEIVPEFEQEITSPINAVIKSTLFDAGTKVEAGQAIMELDKEYTQIELEKLKYELELKKNNITKIKLQLDKSYYDLKANDSIKQLRINSFEAAVQDAKRLYKAGGGTREEVEQAELNLKVALLEKRQLENEISNKQQTMRTDMKESEINAAIQGQNYAELEKKLQHANIVATRSGVITWVNKNIGATVNEGTTLVKIADLSSYKVTGTISDNYASELKTGMTVIVRINDSTLRGAVVAIRPAVQNGIITFDVQMDNRSSKLYRANMKTDIFLVTDAHTNVLRVANGPAFKGGNSQDIFVVKNGIAERRSVNIGMSNFDFVEIKNNVKAGELVITSDLSDFKHLKNITIKE
jgi:HlyD family secretion protein